MYIWKWKWGQNSRVSCKALNVSQAPKKVLLCRLNKKETFGSRSQLMKREENKKWNRETTRWRRMIILLSIFAFLWTAVRAVRRKSLKFHRNSWKRRAVQWIIYGLKNCFDEFKRQWTSNAAISITLWFHTTLSW